MPQSLRCAKNVSRLPLILPSENGPELLVHIHFHQRQGVVGVIFKESVNQLADQLFLMLEDEGVIHGEPVAEIEIQNPEVSCASLKVEAL